MSETITQTLVIGGGVGEDGVIRMVGNDMPFPVGDVNDQFDVVQFMQAVSCFNCPVMSEFIQRPDVKVEQVPGLKRTLITGYCQGAVELVKAGRQRELGCHQPKAVKLVFQKK